MKRYYFIYLAEKWQLSMKAFECAFTFWMKQILKGHSLIKNIIQE